MNIDDLEGLENLDEKTHKEVEGLLKITREKHGIGQFIISQFRLVDIFEKINAIENLIKIWNNIKSLDGNDVYALAQLKIGELLYTLNKLEEAIVIWNDIKECDNTRLSLVAKYRISCIQLEMGDIDEALNTLYSNTVDDGDIYYDMQLLIGRIILKKIFTNGDVIICKDAKKAFIKAEKKYLYEVSCYLDLCDIIIILGNEKIDLSNYMLTMFYSVLKVISILTIDFNTVNLNGKAPERKLAHYTSMNTAEALLASDDTNKVPSYFRLNTINNVNDPSEGHLLINFLKGLKDGCFNAPEFDSKFHAFIGCFTLNHDSLNQFRLYGKKDYKEASGISLVFKESFFDLNSYYEGLTFLSVKSRLDLEYNKSIIDRFDNTDQGLINKQPIIRCVYIDPNSGFIKVSQRNELTFYREFGNEKLSINKELISRANYEWNKYEEYIKHKTKIFEEEFKKIKFNFSFILEEIDKIENRGLIVNSNIEELIDKMLLPLKYLVKHSAFQEEQECRMIYITSLDAPEIKMKDKKFLFVEYREEVKKNLDKVYIAPAATEYQLYLSWLLRDTKVKIELSNNPYRHT